MRRNIINESKANPLTNQTSLPYKISHSTSTRQTDSPRELPLQVQSCCNHKEKTQLCKRFSENGYCPYESRCKFAHGSHQLRRNNRVNNRYKTKPCQIFIEKGCCMYGARCNFIHTAQHQPCKVHLDSEWRVLKMQSINTSRLMKLL